MLPYWIDFFSDLQNVRGRSLNTVMAYRRDLELYSVFSKTEKPIGEFFDFMKEHNLSVRSQARIVSSVRTYLRFCETQGVSIPHLGDLRPPRVKAKLPKIISTDEFEKLFRACIGEDEFKTLRNQLTLMLLYGTGCRVTELISLDINDFSPTERWIKIIGKGKRERLVPLTENLTELLQKYFTEARSRLLKEDKTLGSMLINDRGHRPSRVDVWRWLAAWSSKCGFKDPVNPHRFRHACATSLLENGADLRSIQMLLGHSSIQTTQVYTSVTVNNLVRTVENHHPLSGIKKNRDLE